VALIGALVVVAGLLAVAAGLAKLRDPVEAVAAVHAVSLPAGPALVRLGAGVECSLGLLVLLTDVPVARLSLASAYVGFAVFSVVARRAAAVPCGCFGRGGGTIGWRHVAVDAVLAMALVCAATASTPSALAQLQRSAPVGAGTLAVCAVAALLAAITLSGPSLRTGAHDG
jgi:hypothetical protein